MLARRCYASIKYNGTEITKEISGDLLGFSFKDNMNKADGIELSLKDETGKWMNDWFPEEGDFIEASIHTLNWRCDGDQQELLCGRFIIDSPSYSGPPDELTINGTSIPKDTGIMEPQNRTFEKISLRVLAERIGAWYGCELIYLVADEVFYDYLSQVNESDMALLNRLCKDQAFFLKISDNRLVIAEDKKLVGAPIFKISKGSQGLMNYSFSKNLVSKYKECSISYYSARDQAVLKYVHKMDQDGEKVYHVKQQAENYEDAVNQCKALARRISKQKMICQLEFVGNVELLAGVSILLESFGKFDGEYLISEASHQLDGGYSVSLTAYHVEDTSNG